MNSEGNDLFGRPKLGQNWKTYNVQFPPRYSRKQFQVSGFEIRVQQSLTCARGRGQLFVDVKEVLGGWLFVCFVLFVCLFFDWFVFFCLFVLFLFCFFKGGIFPHRKSTTPEIHIHD